MRGQEVSWAAPDQRPDHQTVPPRPPTSTPTPPPAPPNDNPTEDDDDTSPPSAPGSDAENEPPPPAPLPEPAPDGDDNSSAPVSPGESGTNPNTTETVPARSPGANTPAGAGQVPAEADLSLAGFVDNARPIVDQSIVFTVVMSNSGPSNATNVAVSQSLPDGLVLSWVEPTQGSFSDGSGLWLVPGLQTGQIITLTIAVSVTQAGLLTSTTEIIAVDQFDPDSTPGNGLAGEDDLARVTVAAIRKTPAKPQAEHSEPTKAGQPAPVQIDDSPSGPGIFFDLFGSLKWLYALGLGLLLILAGVFLTNRS